jgi:hypothetical protein
MEEEMTVLIVTIVVAWILASTFLVVIICMNSSRLSRLDEPFKGSRISALSDMK